MGEAGPGHALTVVGIDARLRSGQPGGVEQFIVGLAHGLSHLTDGQERFAFHCLPGEAAWLKPYVSGPAEIVSASPLRRGRQWLTGSLPRRAAERMPSLRALRRRVQSVGFGGAHLPESDGTLERAGARLIHFPTQAGYLTQLPSIYQPWDLQHLHYPSFFDAATLASRELRYRSFCNEATVVVVPSRWGKRDLVSRYGIPDDKVAVVPVPAPITAYAELQVNEAEALANRLRLPADYLLYPAQTWPHKNHIRLLEAIAAVRTDKAIEIHLVCTGGPNEHFPAVQQASKEMEIEHQVHFLGFVSTSEMRLLYQRARGLVFPSLFEGWGLPLVEAMALGVPIACANVTSVPDLVGDAAVMFDPTDVRDIRSAIERLWTDATLRDHLASRGISRVDGLNWDSTARTYRALYRSVASLPLDDEDNSLIASAL
jgi:glycosyltransferase involved in cell wall biosynthesis